MRLIYDIKLDQSGFEMARTVLVVVLAVKVVCGVFGGVEKGFF